MVRGSKDSSIDMSKGTKISYSSARKAGKNFDLVQYFKDVYAEMKKVTWPSWKQLVTYTGVVLLVVIAFAAIFGVIDLGLEKIFRFIIS